MAAVGGSCWAGSPAQPSVMPTSAGLRSGRSSAAGPACSGRALPLPWAAASRLPESSTPFRADPAFCSLWAPACSVPGVEKQRLVLGQKHLRLSWTPRLAAGEPLPVFTMSRWPVIPEQRAATRLLGELKLCLFLPFCRLRN